VELRPGGGGEPLSPVPNRAPQIWQTVGTPPRATVSNKRLPRTAAGEEFTHGLPDLGRRRFWCHIRSRFREPPAS
jgi:hypothetical protein